MIVIKELLDEITKRRFRSYLVGFTRNIKSSFFNSFLGWKWLLHVVAILITIPLVTTGLDWDYFIFFRNYSFLQPLLFPAVLLGSFVPFFLPPIIYLHGKRTNQKWLEPFAYCLTQVAVVGLFWSSLYKAFSGRMGPEFSDYQTGLQDYSQEFYFGFLFGGVFDGWPSGHTTISVAFGLVYILYSREGLIDDNFVDRLVQNRKFGAFFAIYVPIGVSTNIHWLSDVIAGILIGITVGFGTLRNFAGKWNPEIESMVEEGKWDDSVFYTFIIVFMTVFFSIFIPRDLFL